MASTATFDRSDAGIDELVGGWEDGGEYELRIRVRQVSNTPNVGNYEILSVTAEEMPEEEDEEETPAPKKPKTGMVPAAAEEAEGMGY